MLGGYYLGQLYLGISGLPSAGVLSVVPSSHQLSSDQINLTQKHLLIVDAVSHSLTSENITLTQKHVLSVDNAFHTHLGDNASITSEHFLGVDDAYHGLTSTEIQLTQKHTIAVTNTTHTVISQKAPPYQPDDDYNVNLIEHKTLAVQGAQHGHTVDGITISVRSYLDIEDNFIGHTVDNTVLTQKHTLSVSNASHSLLIDALGGLINLQPYGMGGGFGAVDGWGIAEFGSINIELPLNFLILADDTLHNLSSDELDVFIQIFNMIRTGEYIKDFGNAGEVGSEYTKDTGTMPVKQGNFGQITPVPESNQGFFIVEMGTSGSYTQNGKTNGILTSGNSSSGSYSTDEKDTGNYIKIK